MDKPVCIDCGRVFELEKAREEFFSSVKFLNKVKHCQSCFNEKLKLIWEVPGKKRVILCSVCGVEQKVFFTPSEDSPVFCKGCYEEQKT